MMKVPGGSLTAEKLAAEIINRISHVNPLSATPTEWSNTLKQLVGKLSTNCLCVFGHFMKLVLQGLRNFITMQKTILSIKSILYENH